MVKVINSGFGGYTQGGPLQISAPSVSAPPTNERFTAGITNYPGLVTPTSPDAALATYPFWQVDWTRDTALPGQLVESRTSSATYFDATGTLVTAPSGVLRLDYDPDTIIPQGLLIEEQRTNLFIQSASLTNAAWGTTSASKSASGVVGPDGTAATLVTAVAGANAHEIYTANFLSITTGTNYAESIYARAGTSNYALINVQDSGTGASYLSAVFDLTGTSDTIATQTSSGTGATLISTNAQYIGNGWFRISLVGSITGTGAYTIFGIAPSATGNTFTSVGEISFTAAGTETINLALPDKQAGSFATSTIPTTSAAVTRSADILSSTDTGLLAADAWEIEVGELQASTAATLLGINTVTALGFDSSNHATTADGGTQTTVDTGTLTSRNRAGLAFDSTPRVSIVLDGGTVSTAANTPATPTALYFGNTNNGASGFLNGHIRSMAAYTALTDAQLDTLSVVGASYSIAASSTSSGNGSATGAATVTGVGATTAAAAGSSTGSATVTAVGAQTDAAAGSSTGSATVTAVGRSTAAASGAASGAATVSAVGASRVAGAGSATGSATVTATGAATKAAAGSSAGSGTATSVGTETAAATGSSVGSGTATAVGRETAAADGSSTGTGSASAVGAAIEAATGNAAGSGAATAASIAVSWNPSDKDSHIVLSSGNLTASLTSSLPGGTTDVVARGTTTRATGYFEITFGTIVTGAHNAGIGIANLSASLTNTGGAYLGTGGNSVGYFANGFHQDGSGSGTGATFGAGDVLGVNVKASSADFTKNGTLVFTAALPSGALYPAISLANNTDSGTANFGASAMSYLPAGATSWDGSQVGGSVGSATGSAAVSGAGASIVASAGIATGTSAASGTSVPSVIASGAGIAVGTSIATAVGTSIHVGKWHVVNSALAVVPQGAYSDGFSDGFEIDAVSKPWQVSTAKPKITTSWHVVNKATPIASSPGAYSDGFSDGFAIDLVADKIWKKAA